MWWAHHFREDLSQKRRKRAGAGIKHVLQGLYLTENKGDRKDSKDLM